MHLGETLVQGTTPYAGYVFGQSPRNVYWEATLACALACKHCRACAIPARDPNELDTEQGKALIREVKALGSMLVFTGGDPLQRNDLFELIAYAREIGVPVAITPATTPALNRGIVAELKRLGVAAVGISLDGPNPQVHDTFRGVPGTFEYAMDALEWCRLEGLGVQINTTVTRALVPELSALYEVLKGKSPPVTRWSLFLLIPVGRGQELIAPSAQEAEQLFAWVYDHSKEAPFHISTVEAPHYRRHFLQRRLAEGMPYDVIKPMSKRFGFGVRDGNGVIFVSHIGDVYPAGFLPYPLLGNVKESSLVSLYRESEGLRQLRDVDAFHGKCGYCEYRWICGGSRARAYAMTGDALGTDPMCAYEPKYPDASAHPGACGHW